MYNTDALPGEDFKTFLDRVRGTFDEQKDDDMVFIVSPALTINPVSDACPEDVHDQYSVAKAFETILEDCLTYTEWLKARVGGFCEVQ